MCVCVCVYLKMAVDSIVIEGSKDRRCHGNNGSSSCLRMCVCLEGLILYFVSRANFFIHT